MPPQRSLPFQRTPPVRPVKTERTHEENQERAYIAASRRSDRSLEARVESARRASLIHKQRTGRALRITESDVLNEEMYEEEEDDHLRMPPLNPMPSGPYSRQINAYLHHHLAMRDAIRRELQQQQQQQQQHQLQLQQAFSNQPQAYPQSSASTTRTDGLRDQSFSPSRTHAQNMLRHQPYARPVPPNHRRSMSMHVPSPQPAGAIPVGLAFDGTPAQLDTGFQNGDLEFRRRQMSLPGSALSSHAAVKLQSPIASTSARHTPNHLQDNFQPSPFTLATQDPSSEASTPAGQNWGLEGRVVEDMLYPFTTELPSELSAFSAQSLQPVNSNTFSPCNDSGNAGSFYSFDGECFQSPVNISDNTMSLKPDDQSVPRMSASVWSAVKSDACPSPSTADFLLNTSIAPDVIDEFINESAADASSQSAKNETPSDQISGADQDLSGWLDTNWFTSENVT